MNVLLMILGAVATVFSIFYAIRMHALLRKPPKSFASKSPTIVMHG